MTILMTFPGIVIVTARGGETALVENGKPVEGRKSYRVEGHKSLAFDASCWVRLSRDAKPLVVGARSVHAGVRPGIDPAQTLPGDWSLEWLIFTALKCNPATAHVRDLTEPKPDILTPEQIRDEALETTTTFERIKELHAIADQHHRDVILTNGEGDEEPLVRMLLRLGFERRDGGSVKRPRLASAPAEPAQPAASAGNWYDDAIARAASFTVEAVGQAIWRESVAAVREGKCAPDQGTHIQNLVEARIADRRKEASERLLALLSEADEWRDKVRDLAGDEEARAALEEVSQIADETRAGRIRSAIIARFPKAGVRELPAREAAA